MESELAAQCPPERTEDQRQSKHRETDMRDEDEKVSRPNPAVSRELSVAVEVVISNVTDQEQRRKDGGANHKTHVNQPVSPAYVEVAQDEAHRA